MDALFKLRWASIGCASLPAAPHLTVVVRVARRYHYDWTNRRYATAKEEFPPELARLCSAIAQAVGYSLHAEVGVCATATRGRVVSHPAVGGNRQLLPTQCHHGRPSRRRRADS